MDDGRQLPTLGCMKHDPACRPWWLIGAIGLIAGCGGGGTSSPESAAQGQQAGPGAVGAAPAPRPIGAVPTSASCGGADLSALATLVYVRSDKGSDAGTCGTSTANACASIQKGIDSCSAAGCGVIVRHGEYNVTSTVALRDGVSVYGSCLFDGETGRSYRSIVNGPPDQPAVSAGSTASATTFQGFVVRAGDSSVAGGASIAMTVTGSAGLKLTQSRLVAGRGATGLEGGSEGLNPSSPCMTQPGPLSTDVVGSFLFLAGAWRWQPSQANRVGLPASGEPGWQGGASIALLTDAAGAIDTRNVLVGGPGGTGGTGGSGTGSAGGGAGGNGGPSVGLAALNSTAAALKVGVSYPGAAGSGGAGGSGGSGNGCNSTAGQRGWYGLAKASLDYAAIPTWFEALAPGETLGTNQARWGANAYIVPQGDSNFCIYRYDGAAVWCYGGGYSAGNYTLAVDPDEGGAVFAKPSLIVFITPGSAGGYLALDAFTSLAYVNPDGSVAWRAP